MNKILSIIIAIVLIIVSFFVGYSLNKPDSVSTEFQNLQNKIDSLQQQNSQLQNQNSQLAKQIDELQKFWPDVDFLLEFTSYSWPDVRINLTISNKKIILEQIIDGEFTKKSRNLAEDNWNTLTSFFVSSGIFDVKQSDLIRCQVPNCPQDGGSAMLKINYGNKSVFLNTGAGYSSPAALNNVLDKIVELRSELLIDVNLK